MVSRKMRKMLLWLALSTLFAGLVWAAVDGLLSMADTNTTEAASIGAKDELSVVQTAAVPTKQKDNINWTQINKLTKQLGQNTQQYEKLVAQAGAEKKGGQVSEATRSAGMKSAREFSAVSQQLASTYEKGNCITRAKSVRSAAKSRLANAEMAFNKLDTDKINAYNDERVAMSEAADENLMQIKTDADPKDIAGLKTYMLPRLEKLASDTTKLLGQITKLLDEVRKAAGGDAGAMAGCAKSVVTGAADGPGGLLKPVMALMNMVKNMGNNIASTMKALASL